MLIDPISDMLTRIRNASAVRKPLVSMPASKVKFAIAKILEQEGYVDGVAMDGEGTTKKLTVTLKYQGKKPMIQSVRRVSTPGHRVYKKTGELPSVLSGLGMAIVSTPNGLMTNKEAHSRRLGGEVICEIF